MNNRIRIYADYLRHSRLFRKGGVSDEDVFLVSFPKSGNTWVRFILARSLYPESEINLRNILEYFPAAHRSKAEEIKKVPSPRFIKSHYPFFSLYPRSIYIYRDYRDAAVSAFYHVQNRKLYSGSFSEFLRHPLLNYFGTWADHMKKAFDFQLKHPEKIYILRYEDLRSRPGQHIRELHEFCGIQPIVPVEKIIELTSFEKMKADEQISGSRIKDSSGNSFFRQGKSGDWKNYFSASDLKFLYSGKGVKEMMERGGYVI
ncbi:MAG: sulfotransferase domain-containing protein [Bacteroidia bacterium]